MYEAWKCVVFPEVPEEKVTCGSSGRILINCSYGTITLPIFKEIRSFFHIIVGARCGLGAGLSYKAKVSSVRYLAM